MKGKPVAIKHLGPDPSGLDYEKSVEKFRAEAEAGIIILILLMHKRLCLLHAIQI